MEMTLFTDREGIKHKLTTFSAQSSCNAPVYRIEDHTPAGDYGPSDVVSFDGLPAIASGIVALWARLEGRTVEERLIAKAFLSQAPDGPQI